MELAALPDRENQNDTPSRTESCIQFLLIHRQRRPNTLNITEKSLKQFLKSTKGIFFNITINKTTGNNTSTLAYLSFGQGDVLVVVALYEEESGVSQDVTQLAARILTDDKLPYRDNKVHYI